LIKLNNFIKTAQAAQKQELGLNLYKVAETWFSILAFSLKDPVVVMPDIEKAVILIKESVSIEKAVDFAIVF